MTADSLSDVREEARRAEIVRRVNGAGPGVSARVVGAPAGATLPPSRNRDTASLVLQSQQTFLWKDLIRGTDDQMLGHIAEIVELEMSRRGVRR